MPVFKLTKDLVFPPPELADPSGLLAVGGDLSSARLLLAYSNGIFPWYSEGEPIMWWSPDPRMVLFPQDFKPSKSLSRSIASGIFEVRMNTCFTEVMQHCGAVPRKEQEGTWITKAMIKAYSGLNLDGYAHSFETFSNGKLVGGLYGVCIGRAFFGESMFHHQTDASKVAFATLIDWCTHQDIRIIDAQQNTPHLASLGAVEISRKEFLELIRKHQC
jgi:leucyl/phenylalanyl-tRNA---protein transferase